MFVVISSKEKGCWSKRVRIGVGL